MQPSKIHRYLSSFVRTGFVQQTESGEYELGPALRRLGFLAIRQCALSSRLLCHRDCGVTLCTLDRSAVAQTIDEKRNHPAC